MKCLLLYCTVVVSIFVSSGFAQSVWEWRSQASKEHYLSSITFGENLFVVVGQNGIISTSSDGITWTERFWGAERDLESVVYGNNLFVAVGVNGTIITSPDGILWTDRSMQIINHLHSVIYKNNLFVAVGYGSIVLTSPDGIIWTERSSKPTSHLNSVAYGNYRFIAVGGSQGDVFATYSPILTSPNGITWNEITWTITETMIGMRSLNSVVYGNNLFVATGSDHILTSPDGTTWTERWTRTSGGPGLNGIYYVNDLFIAVMGSDTILTSPDGITWDVNPIGDFSYFNSVAYGNNQFIGVGGWGMILSSKVDDVNSISDHSVNYSKNSGTFKLYSDKISAKLTFSYPADELLRINIYSCAGKAIYSTAKRLVNGSATISTAGLPRGFYIVKITDGKKLEYTGSFVNTGFN